MDQELAGKAIELIKGLGPEALLGLSSIVVCYLLKASEKFPNRFIPWVCVGIPALCYPVMGMPAAIPSGFALVQLLFRLVVQGKLIGFLAWISHNQILKRLGVDRLLFGESDKPTTKGTSNERSTVPVPDPVRPPGPDAPPPSGPA